jgi:hypothetical protein
MLCAYRIKQLYLPGWQLPRPVAILTTFLAVHFVWVPFRVAGINQTVGIWQGMLGFNGFGPGQATIFDLGFLTLVAAATLLLPNASERWPGYSGWKESVAIAALALFAIFNTPEINKFIYFQF